MNRRTLHKYPRHIETADFGPVRDKVLLELNCFDSPTPNTEKTISTFIADFLTDTQQDAQIPIYELRAFLIKVLDYRRTFVEKILSLSYSSFEDRSSDIGEVRARMRHLYDLTVLIQEEEISTFLASADFPELLAKVRGEESLVTRTKWKNEKLSAAPMHSKSKDLLDKVEAIFKSDLEPMVFHASDLPNFNDVRDAFRSISKRIKESDS